MDSAEQERAVIVAWLRRAERKAFDTEVWQAVLWNGNIAAAIEALAHHKDKDNG